MGWSNISLPGMAAGYKSELFIEECNDLLHIDGSVRDSYTRECVTCTVVELASLSLLLSLVLPVLIPLMQKH